jgi:hypothetical protein
MKEIIELRVKILKEMNEYIFNKIGDEDIIDYWLLYGMPDDSEDDDFLMVAEDDKGWVNVIKTFANCYQESNFRRGIII